MHRTSETVIPLLKGKIGLCSATIWAKFSILAGAKPWLAIGTSGLFYDGLDSLASNLGKFRFYMYATVKNLMMILVMLLLFYVA
jgi:hypothetical protein